jgi:hypothetical protein
MLVFKRHKKKEVALERKQQHVLFQQWEKMKIKFASYLQQRSELLSLKSKKVILLLFILAFSSGCILLIIDATADNKSSIGIKQISKPSTKSNEDITTDFDSIITQKDYKKIEIYKSYLLQLRDDSVNRKKFDSIILLRPHLLDSITLFEKMYLSQ